MLHLTISQDDQGTVITFNSYFGTKTNIKVEKFFLEKKKTNVPPRVVILVGNTSCPIHISTKYHQNIVKVIQVTERSWNQIQIQEGEITPKVRKLDLSFLYASLCLVLFYISIK